MHRPAGVRARFAWLLAAFFVAGAAMAPSAMAEEATLDVSVFHEPLARHGHWIEVDQHGWVWTPNDVSYSWRPYTVGRWVWVNDLGWTWVSSEPWGWATYHYGNWAYLPAHGWVWVPGTRWAPAWVVWRTGVDHVGWAPLPPSVQVTGATVISEDRLDLSPFTWTFVPTARFVETDLSRVVVTPARNVSLVRGTRVLGRFETKADAIVNVGPPMEEIRRVVRAEIPTVKLEARTDVDAKALVDARAKLEGNTLTLPRLELKEGKATKEPPQARDADDPNRMRERRSKFETEMRSELDALRRQHEQESRSPPAGTSAEELKKRHEAEMKALEEHQDGIRSRWDSEGSDDTTDRPSSGDATDDDDQPGSRPGQPGMGQPGSRPGQPGAGQPGSRPGQPGAGQPGAGQPGSPGQPGAGQPGSGQPGAGQPGSGSDRPGADRPGDRPGTPPGQTPGGNQPGRQPGQSPGGNQPGRSPESPDDDDAGDDADDDTNMPSDDDEDDESPGSGRSPSGGGSYR